jgi:hypothetical protein
MDNFDAADLNVLVMQLAAIKTKQKELAEKETIVKEQLFKLLAENDSSSETTDYGTVRIQRRQEKDYGAEIRAAEIDLKERKKLADDLGDFTITNVKESLVFNPPKDLF